MDTMQRAAFLQTQAACATVLALGMQAENAVLMNAGKPPRWTLSDFEALIDQHGIGHNAAITYLSE